MGFLTILLLIPYFGWGIYALRHRYRFHEEFSPKVEAATIAGVAVFYMIELPMLRTVAEDSLLYYVFSVLGLFVSGAALYGHMAISLVSGMVVQFYAPSGNAADRPRLGPARALEKEGDFTGAIQEYLVLARIYPREPELHLCIAECHLRLDQPGEAVSFFERALKMIKDPSEALSTTARLAEVHEHKLEKPNDARVVLESFLARFPEGAEADTVRERLAAGSSSAKKSVARKPESSLSALDEAPLSIDGERSETRDIPIPVSEPETDENAQVRSDLEPLDAPIQKPKAVKKRSNSGKKAAKKPVKTTEKVAEKVPKLVSDSETPEDSPTTSSPDLEPLDVPAPPEPSPEVPESNTSDWGLEALDDAIPEPLQFTEEDPSEDADSSGESSLTLEAMDPGDDTKKQGLG